MFFIDGFEQFFFDGDNAAFMRRAGYELFGSYGFAQGRKNGASIMIGRGGLSRSFPSGGDKFSVGFAFRMTTRGNLVGIEAGEEVLRVGVDPITGLVTSGDIEGMIIPLKTRWYYCEVEINKTSKEAKVFINGKLDLTVPVPDAVATAKDLKITLRSFTGTDFAEMLFDDFYVTDGARVGPITITTRFPAKDVSKDWFVAGAEGHAEAVAVLPPDLLDRFIYAGHDGATDSFTSSTELSEETEVKGVTLVTLIRKATVDPVTVDVFVNEKTVNESSLPRNWEYRYSEMGVIPTHAIPSSVFGVKIKS